MDAPNEVSDVNTLTTADVDENPHLKKYIREFEDRTNEKIHLVFHENFNKNMVYGKKIVNIIYDVGDPVYIHLTTVGYPRINYIAVEPEITEATQGKMDLILENILNRAPKEKPPKTQEEFEDILRKLMNESVDIIQGPDARVGRKRKGFFQRWKRRRVPITEDEAETIWYYIHRNIIGHGPIEPLIRDPFIEDIHVIGTEQISLVHKVIGMVPTNLNFETSLQLDKFLRNMSERIGRPVSDASPVVDGALPDGSRINIIYSEDVSKKGASFTIRKFTETPPTMIQLIQWGTFNSSMAAYLWLALEYKMSIFMSGETASGKTTSLNAMLNFVNYDYKIFTAEDTPEVIVPHPVWQRLVTRESGPEESQVTLFGLVKAALRSRPDYIIVGEIRGEEGAVAFQAMQTGHPVLSTFHASSIQKMLQRFTGHPINVPIRFMDNLNIACFQQLLYMKGSVVRRCSSMEEIIGYSKAKGGVLNRAVFRWDSVNDIHSFRGMFNSHILENKVAPILGLADSREIYVEMKKREKFIQYLVDNNIFGYDTIRDVFRTYYQQGWEAMADKYMERRSSF